MVAATMSRNTICMQAMRQLNIEGVGSGRNVFILVFPTSFPSS
jgi:hypothetical protein